MTKAATIRTLATEAAFFAQQLGIHAAAAGLNNSTNEQIMGHVAAVFRINTALQHRLTLLRELAPNSAEAGSEAGMHLREIAA